MKSNSQDFFMFELKSNSQDVWMFGSIIKVKKVASFLFDMASEFDPSKRR